MAEEIRIIQDTINSPVFIAGDINQTGSDYNLRLFREIRERGIDLPLLIEYFVPPGREYFAELSKNINNYACEISSDSSIDNIRKETGRFYSNEQLENLWNWQKNLGQENLIYISP